jgi:hypothetical protein
VNTSIAGGTVVAVDALDVVPPVDRDGVAPLGSAIAAAFGGRGDVAGPPVHRRSPPVALAASTTASVFSVARMCLHRADRCLWWGQVHAHATPFSIVTT